MKLNNKFLWLDLETTGLNPLRDKILEIATIQTDNTLLPYINTKHVINVPDAKELCNDYITDMHTQNGLFDDIKGAYRTLEQVEDCIIDSLDPDITYILAGSSIHFDRSFIKIDMPQLEKHLHYRMLDVSSIYMLFNSANIKIKHDHNEPSLHRAASDIKNSLACAHKYQGYIRGCYNESK